MTTNAVSNADRAAAPEPAPLDRGALERVLAPFGSNRTLPGRAYTAPEVFAWEQRNLFEGSWVCVGRTTDLPDPGDMRSVRIGGEGILLVRDEGGELRAFYNVCRHRGHEVLPCGETANARVIKCPYHAWVYGLDGQNRAAPRFHDVPGFDRSEFPLIAARVAEWNGWAFVNASGDALPFTDHLGNLDALCRPYGIDRMFVGGAHEYVVEANWKIITENYHECYHCPSIHPELCVVTPTDSGEKYWPTGVWVGGSMDLKDFAETMSLTGESRGVPIPGLEGRGLREIYYFGLFPNLLISLHPDYVMTHRFEPLDAGHSRIECQWLFPPEARGRADFDPSYAAEFWDITNREDWTACESVQRGVASRGYRQGPLAHEEGDVVDFIQLVARAYLDGRASPPPSSTEALRAAAEGAPLGSGRLVLD